MERSEYKNVAPEFLEEAQLIGYKHEGFTNGCRVLFLIQRHKDGGHTNNSKLRSYITNDYAEWVIALGKLLQEKSEYPGMELRIYQTLNPRDVEKGIRHYKHAMLEADYYDKDMRQWFYIDARNRIISALMKYGSRAESRFLFDIDGGDAVLEEFKKCLVKGMTHIVNEYKTKNGYHVITEPFNPGLVELPEGVELKKDAMMLLKY